MSLRLRVTLLAAVVVVLVVAAFGAGTYLVVAGRLQADVDARLTSRADAVDRAAREPPRPPGSGAGGLRIRVGGVADPAFPVFAYGYDTQGQQVSFTGNLANDSVSIPHDVWRSAVSGARTLVTVDSGGTRYRLLAFPFPVTTSPAPVEGHTLQAVAFGQSLGDLDSLLQTLRLVLIAGGAMALVLALAGGWLVARRSLSPVSRLTAAAEMIGAEGEMSRRLPVPPHDDEIRRLTLAFNGSLERVEALYRELEAALDRQRRFVADASHELRTPLATIRTDLETMRRHLEMPRAERAEVLESSLVELRRLSRLAADLLVLARGDSAMPPRQERIQLGALLDEVVADARRICEPRAVSADVGGALGTVRGDHDAVLRAVRAVLENVAHHTPPTTTVSVRAGRDGGEAVIRVEDDGPGVPADVLPRVFDRFVQADPARHVEGNGLGLPIARTLLGAQGGEIEAGPRDPEPGLVVEIRLPVSGGEPTPPPPAAGTVAAEPQAVR